MTDLPVESMEGTLKVWWYGSEQSFVLHPPGSSYEFDLSLNDFLAKYEGKAIRVTVEEI